MYSATGPLHLAALTRANAEDIVTWRYEPPYEIYDMVGADPDELLAPDAGFHAVLSGGVLVGFRSFGPDGQVPGWDYDDSALDTGGGLRPALTGQGLGRSAITAGLDFGCEHFAPAAFRVTVAAFNARALRTIESLGFVRVATFEAARDGREFVVLVRDEAI